MITSYEDYKYYLEADRLALEVKRKNPACVGDEIWKFERLLRKTEYYNNCKRSFFWKPYLLFLKYLFNRRSIMLGFSIPLNVFGPGLSIAHRGTIVINSGAKIGDNCRIHVCVNIGTQAGHDSKAPSIGNNVYIGPGAKIYGDIAIADDIAIGANACVNRSIETPGISIGGIPAGKISDKGSKELLVRATEILNKKE